MQRFSSISLALFVIFTIVGITPSPLCGQLAANQSGILLLDHVTGFTSLPNGIEVRDGDAREQIVALRDDLLRVRIARKDELPEDASWAVLTDARHSSVRVMPEISADHVGFRTASLHAEIDKKTLTLTIRDLNGNVLQQDARPTRFDDDAFRVYKTMSAEEHFFGLVRPAR